MVGFHVKHQNNLRKLLSTNCGLMMTVLLLFLEQELDLYKVRSLITDFSREHSEMAVITPSKISRGRINFFSLSIQTALCYP